jgi:hypothetical protein
MKGLKLAVYTIIVGLSLGLFTPAFTQDVEGSRDHPLFNRLPNYCIDRYEEKAMEQ